MRVVVLQVAFRDKDSLTGVVGVFSNNKTNILGPQVRSVFRRASVTFHKPLTSQKMDNRDGIIIIIIDGR